MATPAEQPVYGLDIDGLTTDDEQQQHHLDPKARLIEESANNLSEYHGEDGAPSPSQLPNRDPKMRNNYLHSDLAATDTQDSIKMFQRAAQALALEESLDSTSALISAARAIYPRSSDSEDNEESTAPAPAPDVIILAPPCTVTQEPKLPVVPAIKSPSPPVVVRQKEDQPQQAKAEEGLPEKGEEKPCIRKNSRFSKAEEYDHDDDADAEAKADARRRRTREIVDDYRKHHRPRSASRGSNNNSARRRPSSARSRSSSPRKTPRTPRCNDPELTQKLLRLFNNTSLSFTSSQLKILELSLQQEQQRQQQSARKEGRRGSTSSRSIPVITPRLAALARPNGEADSKTSGRRLSRMERKLATYALLDDAKECTFQPKITSRRSSENKQGDTNDGDEQNGNNNSSNRNTFMERQEAMEKAKRRELEVARKKKDYEASLDRKSCPCCRSMQSYDEYVDKRKKCPNCDLLYQRKVDWRSKSKSFHTRQEAYVKEKNENLERLIQEEQEQIGRFGRTVIRPGGEKELVLVNKLMWEDVAGDFFARMKEYEEGRKERMEALIKEVEESWSAGKRASMDRRGSSEVDENAYDS